jgi:hypothetical protein
MEDIQAFTIARREYKHLLKRKQKEFNTLLLDKLVSSVSCQKDFWEAVRKVSFKRKQPKNNIAIDVWFQHFRTLLQPDVFGLPNEEVIYEDIDNSMNRPISKEEVLLALRKLKNRKAAGPDGIIGELFKNFGSGGSVLSETV